MSGLIRRRMISWLLRAMASARQSLIFRPLPLGYTRLGANCIPTTRYFLLLIVSCSCLRQNLLLDMIYVSSGISLVCRGHTNKAPFWPIPLANSLGNSTQRFCNSFSILRWVVKVVAMFLPTATGGCWHITWKVALPTKGAIGYRDTVSTLHTGKC